jgi:ABC-2 type transport system permease protein
MTSTASSSARETAGNTGLIGGGRTVPPFGGFNLTLLKLELKRRLSNRRTLVFTLALPIVMYVAIGVGQLNTPLTGTPIAQGGVSVAAYIMVSMAVYGSMFSSASAGGAVAIERAMGWSRQLRLTPLSPVANVATKIVGGLALGLIAVVGTFAAGAISGVRLDWWVWLGCGVAAWLTSVIFTALGLLLGYLVPSENVMQFLGPILAFMSIFGGLFAPLDSFPVIMQQIGVWLPVYGVGELSRAPLTGGDFDWLGLGNVILWLVIFSVGAALAFRRDTKRV